MNNFDTEAIKKTHRQLPGIGEEDTQQISTSHIQLSRAISIYTIKVETFETVSHQELTHSHKTLLNGPHVLSA